MILVTSNCCLGSSVGFVNHRFVFEQITDEMKHGGQGRNQEFGR